jgi:subtilisin family serine protease
VSGEYEWRFTIKANQKAPSNIQARNLCNKTHRFEIATESLPSFMSLQGAPGFQVEAKTEHSVPVQVDSTGLLDGLHEAHLLIRCVTCRSESTCSQDYQRLHIYLTVELQTTAKFVPNRILVTITLDSGESWKTVAKKLASTYKMDVEQVTQLKSLKIAIVVFSLPAGTDVLKRVAEIESDGLVAQPDFIYATSDEGLNEAEAEAAIAVATPTQQQYGPTMIHADRLRGSVTGKGVKIALIDTGIDSSHPGLLGKIAEQADMTGKGFTADVHGTLLAGIIAAEPARAGGVYGIAPGASILAIKACQPTSTRSAAAQCYSLALARGLDFAIEKKAAVINMSLGGPAGVEDRLLKRAVDQAISDGAMVVAAAGNDGPKAPPGFPAALPNVVAVTAVDSKEQLYPSATQGDFVDLAAPGVDIVSTSPGGRVLVSSGTSLAAAFVSGSAALALQQKPQLSRKALQSLLERTAKDLGSPGRNRQFGHGLVDACRSVAELRHDSKLCR